jgi:hypothetical protein
MKKYSILTCFVFFVLMVASCTLYNNYTPEGQEEYRTGTQGIEVSFLNELVFYDQEYLNLQLRVDNKGAYNEPTGKIVLSGYDPTIVKISSDPIDLPEELTGKNYVAPYGSTYFVTAEENGPVNLALADSYESTMQASVCYTYQTIATPTACLLYYPEDTNICRQETIILSPQGGPVGVNEIKQQYMQDQVRFTAMIQHYGEGTVVNPYDTEAYENCPFLLQQDDINHVNVKMEINGLGEPACVPSNGYIALNENGQGIITCTFTLREQKTYTTPLKITMDYAYLSVVEEPFTIHQSSSTDREEGNEGYPGDSEESIYDSGCYCSDANMKKWGGCVCLHIGGINYYCLEGQNDIYVAGKAGDIIEYEVHGSSTVNMCGSSSSPKTSCPYAGSTTIPKLLSIYGTVSDGRTVSERCNIKIS